jgi:hypothetical protein
MSQVIATSNRPGIQAGRSGDPRGENPDVALGLTSHQGTGEGASVGEW